MPMMIMALLLATTAQDRPLDEAHRADAAVTERLNRAVTEHNQAIADENARRDADYRAERARYEAALAENGKVRAEADRARTAFEAAERRHAADMAAWRAAASDRQAARIVPPPPRPAVAAAAPSGRVCATRTDTGSLVKRTRTCGSAESWRRRMDGEQEAARDLVKRNGDNFNPR